MVNVEVSYKGFPIANIPEGQTGRLACRGKKMVSDVTIAYKKTGISRVAQLVGRTITELTADDFEGVEIIGSYVFFTCKELKKLEFSDSVSQISYQAFAGCSGLTSLYFPNTVQFIGYESFFNCTGLKNVVIVGNSNLNIETGAFSSCKALEVVDFSQTTVVPKLNNVNAFTNVPTTCKIVVPDALYNSWISATNWSAVTLTFVKSSEYTGG